MATQPRKLALVAIGTTVTALTLARCGDSSSSSGSGGGATGSSVTITAPGIVGPNSSSPTSEKQPTLTVTNASVSSGAAPTYTFQVATDQSFSSISAQQSGIAQGSAQTSWQVNQPLADGSYFWRARAEAGGTIGPFSAVAQFTVRAPGGGPGESVVVFDPLTNGSALATARQGGTFTPQGWRVDGNGDYLRYDVPTVENGYVQWENLGLTPRGANDASHMLFGMWDPTAGSFRQNIFRVHLQKLWSDPHNPPFIRFRWISQGIEEDAGFDFTGWDPATVYTWRIDWGPDGSPNAAKVFLDGAEIMRIDYQRAYQPNTHYIELGVQEREESVIGAIYRNFVVVRR